MNLSIRPSVLFLFLVFLMSTPFQEARAPARIPETSFRKLELESQKPVLFIAPKLVCGGTERAFVDMLHCLPLTNSEYDVCLTQRGGVFEDFLPKDVSIITLKEATRRRYATVVSYTAWIPIKSWLGIQAQRRVQWVHADLRMAAPDYLQQQQSLNSVLSAVVGVSDNATASFMALQPNFKNELCTIPNFMNVEAIKEKSHEQQLEIRPQPGIVNLVSVGRLSQEKGIDRAIRVHKRLKDEGFAVRWYVIGDGPLRAILEKKVKKAGLRDKFVFLGFRSNPYPYIKAADIVVLPSRTEAAPLVVAEALILGRPIVSTDVGNAATRIRSGFNGLVVPNSLKGLYNGVKALLVNPSLRAQYETQLKGYVYDNAETVRKVLRVLNYDCATSANSQNSGS
jgi:glycosyltransferase involved in cell wall biosynthesis